MTNMRNTLRQCAITVCIYIYLGYAVLCLGCKRFDRSMDSLRLKLFIDQ